MLVVRIELQGIHTSVPGTSWNELKVSFKEYLVGFSKLHTVGTQRGTAALEGTLAMPSKAIDVLNSCLTCLFLPVVIA